jgi:hypothetical protein
MAGYNEARTAFVVRTAFVSRVRLVVSELK